jgi:hypothetical protein
MHSVQVQRDTDTTVPTIVTNGKFIKTLVRKILIDLDLFNIWRQINSTYRPI